MNSSLSRKTLFKAICVKTLLALAVWMGVLWHGYAPPLTSATDAEEALTTPPLTDIFTNNPQGEAATEIGKVTKQLAIDPQQGAVQRIIDIFFDSNLNTPQQKATYYIRGVLNLFLSVIGFVALVYVIYGFYKIFASEGEEGVKEAQKIVIRGGIALAVIGIAWFVVSRFFKIYEEAITPIAYQAPTEIAQLKLDVTPFTS